MTPNKPETPQDADNMVIGMLLEQVQLLRAQNELLKEIKKALEPVRPLFP